MQVGHSIGRLPMALSIPYKNDEEFDIIPDAFYAGFMREDRPKDYTEYMQAVQEYWNIIGLDKKIRERKLKELRDLGIKFLENRISKKIIDTTINSSF
jgi:hypothetical protein